MQRRSAFIVASLCMWAQDWASAQELPTWTLRREFQIGAADHPQLALSQVGDIEVARGEVVFIAQPAEHLVRVVDWSGRFLRTIGRSGEGPGELRSIFELSYSSGRLTVEDRIQQRLTEFDEKGRYIASWGPLHYDSAVLRRFGPTHKLPDGSLIGVPGYYAGSDTSAVQLPLLQFDGEGRLIGRLASIGVGDESRRAQAGNLRAVLPQPVSSHSLWSVDYGTGEIVIVHRSAAMERRAGVFRILRLTGTGDTVLNKAYRVPLRPIDRSAVSDTISRIAESIARIRPFPPGQIAALYRDGWRVPQVQAPVDRVVAGHSGALWLRRGAFLEETALWWVIDREGDIVAQLHVPTSIDIKNVGPEYVWGVEIGDLDVVHVVRFRIARR